MARLQAIFHFRVRDLLVEDDLLAETFGVERDGYQIQIRLPAEDTKNSARRNEPPSTAELKRLFPGRRAPDVEGVANTRVSIAPGSQTFSVVKLIRAELTFDGQFGAADFANREPRDSGFFDTALAELGKAGDVAELVVGALLAWIRTNGRQSWLGLEGELLEGVGAGELLDLDAFRRLPVRSSLRPDLVIHRIHADQVLDDAAVQQFIQSADAGSAPAMANTFLADALFAVQHSQPNATRSALLLAAGAVEMKVQEALRTSASGTELDLVELLLKNPRDWSMRAAALYDRPAAAVLGRSLRSADKDLWKALEKLFERRNALAHRGIIPSDAEIEESVSTAVRVVRWVEAQIPATHAR
jgi:hypothetical protein